MSLNHINGAFASMLKIRDASNIALPMFADSTSVVAAGFDAKLTTSLDGLTFSITSDGNGQINYDGNFPTGSFVFGSSSLRFSFDVTMPETALSGTDSIQIGFAIVNASGTLGDINAAYLRVAGLSRENPLTPLNTITVNGAGYYDDLAGTTHRVDVSIDPVSRDVTVTVDGTPYTATAALDAAALSATCKLVAFGRSNFYESGKTATATLIY